MSDYGGSQAFASISRGSESVNRSTGSLSFTKPIVSLIGVKKTIDLHLTLRYGNGLPGSFGLPSNWSFDIPFLKPHKSLTKDGRTYIIDFTWADELNWHSGLRYVNNHGIKLTFEGSRRPLPSGQPGYYEWKYQQPDGTSLYFDGTGKLLERDDLHNNYHYYTYVNNGAAPDNALLEGIRDSWGQTITFGYNSHEMVITAPDAGQTKVYFDQRGVLSIQDAMGCLTTFVYTPFSTQHVLSTITYPYGLTAKFTYQQLAYLDTNDKTQHFAAVQDHFHLKQESILSRTSYTFGSQSGSATFTGYSAGYRLNAAHDALMESNNLSYQYDTLIANYGSNNELLSASRVFFNFLHLPVTEVHYTLPSTSLVPTYRTLYNYSLGANMHARSTNYSMPVKTEQFHLVATGDWQPLRRSKATYDSYGCLLSTTDEIWQAASSSFSGIRAHICTYSVASWGGQMLATELFDDKVISHRRMLVYGLTADGKNVARIVTQHQTASEQSWTSWKQKDLTWDPQGRLTSEIVSFSSSVLAPVGTPSTYKLTSSYEFDSSGGSITTYVADGEGNTRATTHSTLITLGPITRKQLPMGQAEKLEYDRLGRLTKYTNPMGAVTTTQYAMGAAENSVVTTNPMGYTTKRSYSVRGELIQISDNSTSSGRVLRETSYDSLSRPVSKTNELGLTTTFAYDALNRLCRSSDYLQNITTYVHDDANLTQTSYVNGQLRTTTEKDAYGREIRTTQHADTQDTSIDYALTHQTIYSGFSLATSTATYQQSISDGSTKLLFQNVKAYDPEFAVIKETVKSAGSDLSTYDTVERQYRYDIFGHIHEYSKTVTYADGRSFSWQSPKSFHDSCGRLVRVQNQLGREEHFTYDENDYLTSMVRYNGNTVRYDRDPIGRLTQVTSPTQTQRKEYLQNGRQSRVETVSGDTTASITYSYTLDGSLSGVTHADGTGQSYTLDEHSRVLEASDALGTKTTTSYRPDGLVSSRSSGDETMTYRYRTINHVNNRLGGDDSRSTSRELQYDSFDRLTRSTVRDEKCIVLDNAYVFNSQGKMVKTEVSSEAYPNRDELNYVRSYAYDGIGQLVLDTTQFKSGKLRRVAFTYDGNHNITRVDIDGVVADRTYNAIDQRTDAGFTWDVNGRMLTDDEGRKYSYSNDRLSAVTIRGQTMNFSFAPNGAFSMKESKGTRELYYYDMGSVNAMRSVSDDTTLSTSYLQEPGRRVASFSDGKKRQDYFETQGSTALTIEGTNATAIDYAAYGATAGASPEQLFGYKQELTDSASGLIYLRARFYQPHCGTFLTQDIAAKENRYSYCNGDPTNLEDRTGRSPIAGMIVGGLVGTGVTVGVGVLTGGVGAVVLGPECIEASIGAGTVAGAAGNFSGDLTSSLVDHRQFTAVEGVEDLVSGGIGGAVGTGLGGVAGSRAMSAALAEGMSQRAITITGSVTSGVVGGASGGFSGSASMAVMTGQPVFSKDTAISTVTGAFAGAGGGMLHSGAYLGLLSSHVIPVPLTTSELSLIMPAVQPSDVELQNALYVMAPQSEAMSTYQKFNTNSLEPDDALRLRPGVRPREQTYDTIAAHGLGGSVFASVRYAPGEVLEGGARAEPNYVRPVKGKLFAQHMAGVQAFNESTSVKFLSCFGAYSNAQAMATALDADVWASYEEIDRFSAKTKWKKFSSGAANLHES